MEYTLDDLARGADFFGGALDVGKDADGNAANGLASRAKKDVLLRRRMQLLRNELALLGIDASGLHGSTEHKPYGLIGCVDGIQEHADSDGCVVGEGVKGVAGDLAILIAHGGLSLRDALYVLKYLRKAVALRNGGAA